MAELVTVPRAWLENVTEQLCGFLWGNKIYGDDLMKRAREEIGKVAVSQDQDAPAEAATDKLIADFAMAVAEKLRAADAKYGWNDGWMGDDWENLRVRVREHLEKGDPRDVAAYCAFAWYHGWSLANPGTTDTTT